ncbi:hypothetical protein ACS0TY_011376 [Phlomoides rotata]
MIINVSEHFMTCMVNLKTGRFTIFYPLVFQWKDDHIPQHKAMVTTPWRRLISLVIKYAGLYEDKPDVYRGFKLEFGLPGLGSAYMQEDPQSCGAYALMHVVMCLTFKFDPHHSGLANVQLIRNSIAYDLWRYIREKFPSHTL